MTKNTIVNLAKCIPFCVGAVLLYFSAKQIIDTSTFIKKSTLTKGYVFGFTTEYGSSSSDSNTYYTDVYFKDNTNKTVYIRSSSSSSFVTDEIGDEVNVRYIIGKSNEGRISSYFFDMWGPPILLAAIGILPTIVGFMLLWNVIIDIYNKRNAKNFTRIINPNISKIHVDHSLVVSGESPYIIEAEWHDHKTKETHTFVSENLWENPTDKVKNQIVVKVDTDDYSKYWMDISFLKRN
ncbi:DUF3592 domain-containing protein [Tenacibaculum agarivorans]|uniref:DUF3592 domain-containing protein n=1 Tax=Tenacibaculum agarivorans TaxID=1908389 RepID=UPI00094B91D5|nr:DUF3592 domain-containing protein [Tenacibaculum agarivorans]